MLCVLIRMTSIGSLLAITLSMRIIYPKYADYVYPEYADYYSVCGLFTLSMRTFYPKYADYSS